MFCEYFSGMFRSPIATRGMAGFLLATSCDRALTSPLFFSRKSMGSVEQSRSSRICSKYKLRQSVAALHFNLGGAATLFEI